MKHYDVLFVSVVEGLEMNNILLKIKETTALRRLQI